MLTKIIKEVPDDLFSRAWTEISAIDFSEIKDKRGERAEKLVPGVFSTSITIQLRVHKPPINKPLPKTIPEWSLITECIDHPLNSKKYPEVMNISRWIFNEVNGVELGRIMIINLSAGGIVAPHIDPADYFEQFSRYHIPFKTNPAVVFNNGSGSPDEHMPIKTLCRLNNRLTHALYNKSNENRIHLIVDVKEIGGNQIF